MREKAIKGILDLQRAAVNHSQLKWFSGAENEILPDKSFDVPVGFKA